MISEVLVFLKDHLNAHLNVKSDLNSSESAKDKVVFLNGQEMDTISFPSNSVSALLINIEEENILRPADPYTSISADGRRRKVQPDIRLNLYVLFVARFAQYEQGLKHLSWIIQYFHNHRVFDSHNAPELNENVERLIMELVTLPFSEQNELWNSLRTTYHPSVLYKVKTVVLKDELGAPATEIKETRLNTVRISS